MPAGAKFDIADYARRLGEDVATAENHSEGMPPEPPRPPEDDLADQGGGWYPSLNPKQAEIFDDVSSSFVLGYGEKGSGKSVSFGHKIIRHCYLEDNAFAIIIAPVAFVGTEGIWNDLFTFILPQWVDGIGLEHTESMNDSVSKHKFCWIANQHGGWSKITLISIPHAMQIERRVTGPAPSLIYLEEGDKTDIEAEQYLTQTSVQLQRRRGIQGIQQWCCSCNPTTPKHWLYKKFFVDCIDEKGNKDAEFSAYHVPMSENVHNVGQKYVDNLYRIHKGNKAMMERLIHGRWVDTPSGRTMFASYFDRNIHVRGNPAKNLYIEPKKVYPIRLGYDLGDVNHAISFTQEIPTTKGDYWIVFDEIFLKDFKVSLEEIAPMILRKMNFWCRHMSYSFMFEHISDASAFDRYRSAAGSYDHMIIEAATRTLLAEDVDGRRFPWLKAPVRMVPCPKPPNSVRGRVRLLRGLLNEERIIISANCPRHIEMLEEIEHLKDKPLEPSRVGGHIHIFDSVTYPVFDAVADESMDYGTNTVKAQLTRVG